MLGDKSIACFFTSLTPVGKKKMERIPYQKYTGDNIMESSEIQVLLN